MSKKLLIVILSTFFVQNLFAKSVIDNLFDTEDSNIYINLNIGLQNIRTKNFNLLEDKYNSKLFISNSLNKKFDIQTGIILDNLKIGFEFSNSKGYGNINFYNINKSISFRSESNNFLLNISSLTNLNKSFDFELGGVLGLTKTTTDKSELLNDFYERYYLNFGIIFGLSYNINENNSILLSLKPNAYLIINKSLDFPLFYITTITSLNIGYLYKF